MKLEFTGERYLPSIRGDIELEHIHRYLFASQIAKEKTVLDIACGEGYGCSIIARVANQVIGVDVDKSIISYASEKYNSRNIFFTVGNCNAIPLKDDCIDIVVSYETIEHHEDHQCMIDEIKRVLKPNGICIISSPDKYEYSDKANFTNEFHIKELYKDEFKALLETSFQNVKLYGQRVVYGSLILNETGKEKAISYKLTDNELLGKSGLVHALYSIAVATNRKIPLIGNGVLEQSIEHSQLMNGIGEREKKIKQLYWKISERDKIIEKLDRDLNEQKMIISNLYSEGIEKDKYIRDLKSDVLEQEQQKRILSETIEEQNNSFKGLNKKLFERHEQIKELNKTLDDKNNNVRNLTQELDERQKFLRKINKTVTEQHHYIEDLNRTLFNKQEQIKKLNKIVNGNQESFNRKANELKEKDEYIGKIKKMLRMREMHLDDINKIVNDRDERIKYLDNALIENQEQIKTLEKIISDIRNDEKRYRKTINEYRIENYESKKKLNDLENILATLCNEKLKIEQNYKIVTNSNSWRMTKPLRNLRRYLLTKPYFYFRKIMSDCSRNIWNRLPVSNKSKNVIKDKVFTYLPTCFKWSYAYRNWRNMTLERNGGQISKNNVQENKPLLINGDYVEIIPNKPPMAANVLLICFYLPQFHTIPENDEWWGEGFTEWTNVKKAMPMFKGHYQPRVPGELGWYNLLDEKIQRRQIELAKLYGIGGFCFYFYWFEGKRLLEKPVVNYLNNKELDLSFCLCWANENWSRTWDGLDNEVLIEQRYSAEDDLEFIKYISKYLQDRRYIRVDGKPLLLVYRPNLFPDIKRTVERWRKWCRKNEIGEIYLAYTQSFEKVNPSRYGFDAAVEFPPNNSNPPEITKCISTTNNDFPCKVFDWKIFVDRSENYDTPKYSLFRSVCPSWDNTARRNNCGTVFLNSSPVLYQRWLKNAINNTLKHREKKDEQIVFVNAWNEWAEGAYLEPDEKYGYAYLQATRNAIEMKYDHGNVNVNRKIVLVAHDAYPHGAQMLILNIARTLNSTLGFKVAIVCLGSGPLQLEYGKWADIYDLSGIDPAGEESVNLVKNLYSKGFRSAVVNTTVSGSFLETLSRNRFKCVTLIHEMEFVLKQMGLKRNAENIAKFSDKIVFAASEVADSFRAIVPLNKEKIIIRPQGLYKNTAYIEKKKARSQLRNKLMIPEDSKIILGVGYADYRKGVDLFVEAGLHMMEKYKDIVFVWVGHWEKDMYKKIVNVLLKNNKYKDKFIFTGIEKNTDIYYRGADIFVLSSREDPFPSVVLEALDSELPVVGFKNAGGFQSLLSKGCGQLAIKIDSKSLSDAISTVLNNNELKESMSARGKQLIRDKYNFKDYVFDLMNMVNYDFKKVSVIVPNFNYAHYLKKRLSSITAQSYPVYEIIVLDDKSTDDSLEILDLLNRDNNHRFEIVKNNVNSGSVFSQWLKGVEIARGDYIWIAEADDMTEKTFLEFVLEPFDKKDVVLSYCQSKQMNEGGNIIDENYLKYTDDISRNKWKKSYINNGEDEIKTVLAIKNTIPNVSAVVFRRSVLLNVLRDNINEIKKYKIAGDWITYLKILEKGNIAYNKRSLNLHRRHTNSVTIGSKNEIHYEEILSVQNMVCDRYDISENIVCRAKKYTEELIDYFNLY